MSWFSRLFRRGPPTPTLEESIAALGSAPPDVILKTAQQAEDRRLRVAAVGMLPDCDVLRSLAGLSASSDDIYAQVPVSMKRAARTRLAELIDKGSIDFGAFCALAKSQNAVFSVAALCLDTDRLPQALASVTDQTRLAQLVVDGPAGRLRQLAAEAIDDPAQIKRLLVLVRNKDRTVYEILKRKSDAPARQDGRTELRKAEDGRAQTGRAPNGNAQNGKAQTGNADDTQRELSAFCASIERHSRQSYDALYTSTFERFNAQWRLLLPKADAGTQQRVRLAMDRCREIIADHLMQREQQAAREAVHDKLAAQAAVEPARALPPSRADPPHADAPPEPAPDLEERLRRAAIAVRQAGETARAEQRIAEQRQFHPFAESADHARLMQQLDDRLGALGRRTVTPAAQKRLELIEAMEALIGSAEEPGALSERIQSLQRQWQATTNGLEGDAPGDSERFNRALQSAFQPCVEHFEALARRPQENLQKRKMMLERLISFESGHDWNRPDWRLLARVVREAPQEWRQYSPVDRDAGEADQGEFDALMVRLRTRLDAWYAADMAHR